MKEGEAKPCQGALKVTGQSAGGIRGQRLAARRCETTNNCIDKRTVLL